MRRFAETAGQLAATTSRLKKVDLLATYLGSLPEPDLRAAAVFFTGRPFPLTDARTLNVGVSAIVRAVQEISQVSDNAISSAYLEHGDLGDVVGQLLRSEQTAGMTPSELHLSFKELAETQGAGARQDLLLTLFRRLSPAEAQFVAKIMTGDLRIGLKESTVEDAISRAFEQPAEMVRRTNMALGDIGETAVRALNGILADIRFELFRPIKFMLASPADGEAEIFANFDAAFFVEDKYDGIRAQLHFDGTRAALYSRTLDDVSQQFPEIVADAGSLGAPLIADGEVVAYREGQVLPFSLLQKRLGRKRPAASLMGEIPVALIVFDLLYLHGETLIDQPLLERKRLLAEFPWQGRLVPAPALLLEERLELEPLFQQAAQRKNEGLMLKAAASPYAPGKRGKSWLKWKKALATLDVVVTGVELGHGRRRNVLSDYTFAVRSGDELLNIGKAYSGLTDAEILEMTEYFRQNTLQDFGRFRLVAPNVVLEVTFNGIQKSKRHKSGFALRFPRIVRIRTDKTPAEIDTLDTVRRIFESAS